MYPSTFKLSARRRQKILTLAISHGFVALVSFVFALQIFVSVMASAH